ncbi:MAG: nucleotidyltransferase family protein [Gemmatimonadales bacterium]
MPERDWTTVHLWPSAEQRLLLTAALSSGPAAVAAFDAWSAGVNLAADFSPETVRLLPLVYHNMRREQVQAPVMGRLKGVYRRAWCETQRLFHQVQPRVSELHQAGIPLLLLKGAPLALAYYDNVALRPMCDVDIAVPAADVERAIRMLDARKWHAPQTPDADLRRFRHAAQFIGPDGGEVDLHWHLLNEAPTLAADRALGAVTEPFAFQGTPVRQLDPAALLVLLVVHGVRWNDDTPVRWIPDAIMVLRRRGADLDWNRLMDLAIAHRVTHRLGLGLTYLHDLFGAAIPADILARLSAHRLSLVERVERRVLLADTRHLRRSALGNQWLWFAEYCRYSHTRNPIAFASGWSHYLRFRLKAPGRRAMLSRAMRHAARRFGRQSIAPGPAGGRTTP